MCFEGWGRFKHVCRSRKRDTKKIQENMYSGWYRFRAGKRDQGHEGTNSPWEGGETLQRQEQGNGGKRWWSHFEMKKERMLKELTTGNIDFAIISKMISERVIVLSR